MKNTSRKLFGILTQLGCTLLATGVMYVCSYIIQIGELHDDEMPLSLVLPFIMFVTSVIIYLIWFGSKEKKFTSGYYVDYRPQYYQRPLFIALTIIIQYLVGFVVTFPLFGFYIEVSVPMLLSLALCEIVLVIADIICYVVFCPIARDII